MKDKIAKTIANILPDRVMLWCIIRLYAHTTTQSHPDKTPDEIGFSLLYKSWEFKNKYKVADQGFIK